MSRKQLIKELEWMVEALARKVASLKELEGGIQLWQRPQLKEEVAAEEGKVIRVNERRVPNKLDSYGSDNRHVAYLDSRGNLTVGYGHLLVLGDTVVDSRYDKSTDLFKADDTHAYILANGMPEEVAQKLFEEDLKKAHDAAVEHIGASLWEELPDPIKEVCIDMSFNLGGTKFRMYAKFKRALENKDYEQAARESYRHGIGEARNRRTADKIRSAM